MHAGQPRELPATTETEALTLTAASSTASETLPLLAILQHMHPCEYRVVDLVKHLGPSQSTASKPPACLKDTGVVTPRMENRASMRPLAHPEAIVAILAAAENILALTVDAVRR